MGIFLAQSATRDNISGLRETFVKRYIVERTNKAQVRSEVRDVKAESCQENVWNEMQLKGP